MKITKPSPGRIVDLFWVDDDLSETPRGPAVCIGIDDPATGLITLRPFGFGFMSTESITRIGHGAHRVPNRYCWRYPKPVTDQIDIPDEG